MANAGDRLTRREKGKARRAARARRDAAREQDLRDERAAIKLELQQLGALRRAEGTSTTTMAQAERLTRQLKHVESELDVRRRSRGAQEIDPFDLKRHRDPSRSQSPAVVKSVVTGGAPGLGKRS